MLEVLVEHLRHFHELLLALVLGAEAEQLLRGGVVQFHQAGILTQGVEDDLVRFQEEVDLWLQLMALEKLVDVAVRDQQQLFGGGFAGLEHGLLDLLDAGGSVVRHQQGNAIGTFLLLDFSQDFVVLLDKVLED